MTNLESNDLKDDLNDFRNGKFHAVPCKVAYQNVAVIFLFCMFAFSAIHIFNDCISGAFNKLASADIKHHIFAIFLGSSAVSFGIAFISSNILLIYEQYKDVIRSGYLLRIFLLKLVAIFFGLFFISDFIGFMPHMSWVFRKTNFDTTTLTNALIPFFLTFCFYNYEVNRTALGPMLKIISDNLPRKKG